MANYSDPNLTFIPLGGSAEPQANVKRMLISNGRVFAVPLGASDTDAVNMITEYQSREAAAAGIAAVAILGILGATIIYLMVDDWFETRRRRQERRQSRETYQRRQSSL